MKKETEENLKGLYGMVTLNDFHLLFSGRHLDPAKLELILFKLLAIKNSRPILLDCPAVID